MGFYSREAGRRGGLGKLSRLLFLPRKTKLSTFLTCAWRSLRARAGFVTYKAAYGSPERHKKRVWIGTSQRKPKSTKRAMKELFFPLLPLRVRKKRHDISCHCCGVCFVRTNEEVQLVTPFTLDGPGSQKRMAVAGFPLEHGTGWRPAGPEP